MWPEMTRCVAIMFFSETAQQHMKKIGEDGEMVSGEMAGINVVSILLALSIVILRHISGPGHDMLYEAAKTALAKQRSGQAAYQQCGVA